MHNNNNNIQQHAHAALCARWEVGFYPQSRGSSRRKQQCAAEFNVSHVTPKRQKNHSARLRVPLGLGLKGWAPWGACGLKSSKKE